MKKLSIIVPAYNEEEVIELFYNKLKEVIDKITEKYETIDDYLSYYLIRYYIWYLLFSGRNAKRSDFILEYKRIKKWYNKKNISLKIMPWSRKISGESLKNRCIVICFTIIEKLHLMRLFSNIYCKGR